MPHPTNQAKVNERIFRWKFQGEYHLQSHGVIHESERKCDVPSSRAREVGTQPLADGVVQRKHRRHTGAQCKYLTRIPDEHAVDSRVQNRLQS